MTMTSYWFEFEYSSEDLVPIGARLGCGVTARSYEDAVNLLSTKVFKGRPIPEVRQTIDGVKLSELDADHVRPNMGDTSIRGIWFPLGY